MGIEDWPHTQGDDCKVCAASHVASETDSVLDAGGFDDVTAAKIIGAALALVILPRANNDKGRALTLLRKVFSYGQEQIQEFQKVERITLPSGGPETMQ